MLDASTGAPLSYCHVFNPRTADGTITNEDGVFQVGDILEDDTLRFSFIGYSQQLISVARLKQDPNVRLKPQSITLEELFIYAEDDYLYTAVENCAKIMQQQPLREAKAYYYVTTDIDGEPNELLESYYNAEVKGATVRNLKLKNGRAGLPLNGEKYFFNLQTSTGIMMLETIGKTDQFPFTPMHYSSRKMKKMYELQRLPSLSDTNTLHIAFTPLQRLEKHFRGEMWIDKNSKMLQKLQLEIDDSEVHPFYSLGNKSRIDNMSFDIVQTFRQDEKGAILDHIEFSYDLGLMHTLKDKSTTNWELHSSCLMHFFEYDTTFILPYFQYDPGMDDYRRISFMPYDSLFWSTTQGYEYSEDQARRLRFFEQEGFLLNFESDIQLQGSDKPTPTLEKPNILWSDEDRIKFGMNRSSVAPARAEFLSDMVEVEVQIFLDANAYDDNWAYNSVTVLDSYRSYNYIGESPERNCYANIYFDLCEIQRRKLLDELVSTTQTRESIDRIYNKHIKELSNILDQYNEEVDLGMKVKEMKPWNELVKAALNIDNIELFGLSTPTDR